MTNAKGSPSVGNVGGCRCNRDWWDGSCGRAYHLQLSGEHFNLLYSYPGNTLISYGGDKVKVDIDGYRFPKVEGPRVEPLAIKTISDTQRTYYGDAYVETSFYSTVRCDIWWSLPQWAEVEGSSETGWWGTEPQFYSDKIKLDESWRFNGISVYVSFPPGFSGSGNTVTWSGEDDSGTSYRLVHIYSGIRGESWVALTSVRQNSNGSHFFESTHTWVSANATDGCSTA